MAKTFEKEKATPIGKDDHTLSQNVLSKHAVSTFITYTYTLSHNVLHIHTVPKCVTNTVPKCIIRTHIVQAFITHKHCPKMCYKYILSQNLLHIHTVPKFITQAQCPQIFVHTHCPKNVLHIHSLTKFILNFGIKVEPVTAAGADATVNDWLLFTYSINGHKPDIHISFHLLQLCRAWFLGVQIQIMKLALGQCTCSSAML